MPFCGKDASSYDDIGCRIEVVSEISNYHKKWHTRYFANRILVNFHGQIVKMDYWPGKERLGIYILVDLAQQTQVRLMLPARTLLVANKALQKLKDAIEIEYYRYFQRQKDHSLYYCDYLRARELGISLPEANPKYQTGLIRDEYGMAAQVTQSKNFRLSDGYLFFEKDFDNELAEKNVHLLGALGNFESNPFVPVSIESGYICYSWADLPKVTKVEVKAGKEKLRSSIQSGELVCVESLTITVCTSNSKTFSSSVPMAVSSEEHKGEHRWTDDIVYVTPNAGEQLDNANIWYHLGGYSDEGDPK